MQYYQNKLSLYDKDSDEYKQAILEKLKYQKDYEAYILKDKQDISDVFSYFKSLPEAFNSYLTYASDRITAGYPISDYTIDENGNKYIRVKGVRWYTNMDYIERHTDIELWKKYTPEEYPKFDNYDAINIDKVADIPEDYHGEMGVPITFLDKYNPEQFEILGITLGNTVDYEMTNIYKNAIQHNKNGTTQGGSKVNTRAAILVKEKPTNTVYYTADGVEGYLLSIYPRILIRRKQNGN